MCRFRAGWKSVSERWIQLQTKTTLYLKPQRNLKRANSSPALVNLHALGTSACSYAVKLIQ